MTAEMCCHHDMFKIKKMSMRHVTCVASSLAINTLPNSTTLNLLNQWLPNIYMPEPSCRDFMQCFPLKYTL